MQRIKLILLTLSIISAACTFAPGFGALSFVFIVPLAYGVLYYFLVPDRIIFGPGLTMMNFVVIGEMIDKLSDEFKKNHPEVEWIKIKGFRNIVAHDYFGIDAEEVWQIIKTKIPILQSDIRLLLD